MKTNILALLFMLLLGGAVYWAWKDQQPAPAPTPAPVRTLDIRLVGDDGPLAHSNKLIYQIKIDAASTPEGLMNALPQAILFADGAYCGPELLDGPGPIHLRYIWGTFDEPLTADQPRK